MKNLQFIILILAAIACSPSKQAATTQTTTKQTTTPKSADGLSFLLTEISTDRTYGLSEKNPVEVGGAENREGPLNERRYLNALAGPNGEKVSYYRAGSCCGVKSKNGLMGIAILDNYRVTWEGSKDTVSIYINMYDYGILKAPVGFTIRK